MKVLNAMQLKAGAKVEQNKMGTITQPVQFLPYKDKDEQWCAENMDWIEFQGIRQLRRNSRRLLKNYKLAKGIIDRSDYIVEEDNEYRDMIETLTKEDSSALELKFYPIIPNIINVLTTEFAKRATKITYRATDQYSHNELLDQKRAALEQALIAEAQNKILAKFMDMGMDMDDEQVQQSIAPENIKTLPEIEEFFRKRYQSVPEIWATHQHQADEGRFHMDELEEMGFRDMLITDREFWHFRMMDDDYDVELWNPALTFYHKSPDVRYVSQGNWVGKVDMMTIPDVIDKYGAYMTEDQLESLEMIYPVRSAGYLVGGMQNDGSYYDSTKSHEWNTNMPGLDYRRLTSADGFIKYGGDIVNWILGESEDFLDFGSAYLVRVATIYWKTQRRVGHLTKIDDNGEVYTSVVDETYKTTDKPIYDLSLFKNKTKDTLVFGEHIDWIYINEVFGGVKIGPNLPSYWGMNNAAGVNPMYIGINKNCPGRLKYQFKGDQTLYGCKLPVEGCIFSDRNTRSTSLVDLTKPFQVGFNMVNNQIADIIVDELGTIIALDHNALPKKSLSGDWETENYSKAYVAMKNFQILPLDTTLANTENAINQQHMQLLNLEQTNRLMSRVQLANYFKQQCFEVIGITPQRLGQQIGRQTATGVEESLNASYNQTEKYFMDHCDKLMPRVHQMRTDLAQYYQSTNPSVRLQYITSNDERVNFQMNGTSLLLRDLNTFASTKTNHRNILERLKSMMVENNTTGASIYDLGKVMQTESMAELNIALKAAEEKQQAIRQQEQQHEQQLQEQAIAAKQEEARLKMEFEASENEKDRQAKIIEAEIRAAAMTALPKSDEGDFAAAMDRIQGREEYQESMNLDREKETNKVKAHQDKMNLEREKLVAQQEMKNKDLQIARENKNQFDAKKRADEKAKAKKK
jgi:hypothetical protein